MNSRKLRRSLAGVLAAGMLLTGAVTGGGAAQAAGNTQVQTFQFYKMTNQNMLDQIGQQYGIDLQKLFESYPQLQNPGIPQDATAPSQPADNVTPPASNGNTGNTGSQPADTGAQSQDSAYAAEVVSLVNQERSKAGLAPLASDAALSRVALDKAKDMYHNNYFSHQSPTYGSPFDMMRSYGISYSYAGENIASGQRTPQEVVTAWMNSPGHKANILGANFTKIGVGFYNNQWVQHFTG
ncbi:CAP domain-containing protein [Paenibacillus sp. 1P07SE]|uniref:CAP domain-containing protein n=1 Tax=Paenibacillus sp. 1P07SE TaxID=3132209 RepID=UPI0039A40958